MVQMLKELKDYKEEPFEEVSVSVENEKKYPAIKSVKMKSSDQQLRENRRTSQSSKAECQAVPRKMAIQLSCWENEVKIVIHQAKQNDFSVQIDISSGDIVEHNEQ